MDELAFLNAIAADPDDDVPRLVYADWLQERGHDERAELIRLQCRAASLDEWLPEVGDLEVRAEDLIAEHELDWLGEWAEWRTALKVRRSS